eukprot:CAMPEP_0197669206 /NCGR_PEP_ID=MMETSP1338-20131121/71375_1 /TAXON_ID=43686 ORGANISM="Pelagodinium beii, Strain RCC1491" /NCGR_SAMPLE_ID=MMETSP1338 /ASSEMBLY_ACC=CAM_ASM_000754 /LENGTH=116 /DNA_ID=CAMNT_0043248719 /DNA_START=27 /DNA_END=374 /DNA_ORIENTATION=-
MSVRAKAPKRSSSQPGLSRESSVPNLPTVPGTNVPRYHWTTQRNTTLAEVLAKMKKSKHDPAAHLKQHCLQMGAKTDWVSNTQDQQRGPASKAQDPKWSTELKAIETRMVGKIQFQ